MQGKAARNCMDSGRGSPYGSCTNPRKNFQRSFIISKQVGARAPILLSDPVHRSPGARCGYCLLIRTSITFTLEVYIVLLNSQIPKLQVMLHKHKRRRAFHLYIYVHTIYTYISSKPDAMSKNLPMAF